MKPSTDGSNMRFTVLQRAPDEYTTFAPGAFDSSVGHTLDVITPSGTMPGTLVSAKVQDDGRTAELTFDVPGLETL